MDLHPVLKIAGSEAQEQAKCPPILIASPSTAKHQMDLLPARCVHLRRPENGADAVSVAEPRMDLPPVSVAWLLTNGQRMDPLPVPADGLPIAACEIDHCAVLASGAEPQPDSISGSVVSLSRVEWRMDHVQGPIVPLSIAAG
jgi:hypothetical protein